MNTVGRVQCEKVGIAMAPRLIDRGAWHDVVGCGTLKVPRRGASFSQLTATRIFNPRSQSIRDTGNMLYLVGLGLSDETDITVKGLEVAKNASRVYLEAYTSILLVNQSVLVRRTRPLLKS